MSFRALWSSWVCLTSLRCRPIVVTVDKESEKLLKAAEKKLAEAEKKYKKQSEEREKQIQKEVGPTVDPCCGNADAT